jgi:hypothetical protein
MGGALEVKAPNRPAVQRHGVVDLGHGPGPAGSGQFIGTEQAAERAPVVGPALATNRHQPLQAQGFKLKA